MAFHDEHGASSDREAEQSRRPLPGHRDDGRLRALRFRGRFGHYLMAVAAANGADCTAPGWLFSEYDNAVGTGQVHV